MTSGRYLVDRVITLAGSAVAARALWQQLTADPPGGGERWSRTNHRGDQLTLLEGPAAALTLAAASATAPGVPGRLRVAATLAALGAGAFGAADDLAETGSSKGLRGHLLAMRNGQLTTGGLKVLGIGLTGLVAGALAVRSAPDDARRGGMGASASSALDVVVAGALVAGTANLFNLLDLRPGRALKVALVAAPAVVSPQPAGGIAAAVVGAGAALLPADLGERAMLGDCGANCVGAVLGTAMVSAAPRPVRAALLAVVVALTLASEQVSFTKVIESTPVLRELDALGRRPR